MRKSSDSNYRKRVDLLKQKAKALKQEMTALYYASKNPETGWLPGILILLTLGYALSPIDLIPDFIPVLGYLDDLIILPALIGLSLALIPPEVMKEAREQAVKEPVRLKRSWLTAVIFVLIWISLTVLIIKTLVLLIHCKA